MIDLNRHLLDLRAQIEKIIALVRADEPGAQVQDMAALMRQLIRTVRSGKPNDALADRALDYLKRKGLAGDALRKGELE